MRRATGWLVLAVVLTSCTTSASVHATDVKPIASSVAPSVLSPATVPEPTVATRPETTAVGPVGPDSGGDVNGIGDALFPSLGNPGIDVQHYGVVLDYQPTAAVLVGKVHLDIVMTADRDAFSLDSDGPKVSAVTVDGASVLFTQAPPELLITPGTTLSRGQRIAVDVNYTLSPEPVPSAAGQQVGWFHTAGGSYVLNEPEGAHTWLPSDDHPSDKATFRFEITVPTGLTAVANGAMIEHTSTRVRRSGSGRRIDRRRPTSCSC